MLRMPSIIIVSKINEVSFNKSVKSFNPRNTNKPEPNKYNPETDKPRLENCLIVSDRGGH